MTGNSERETRNPRLETAHEVRAYAANFFARNCLAIKFFTIS